MSLNNAAVAVTRVRTAPSTLSRFAADCRHASTEGGWTFWRARTAASFWAGSVLVEQPEPVGHVVDIVDPVAVWGDGQANRAPAPGGSPLLLSVRLSRS